MNNNTLSNETKVCNKCEQEKTFAEFGKRRTTKDGFDYLCIVCKREERKGYLTPEQHRENQKKYRQQNKEKIKEYNRMYKRTIEDKEVKRNRNKRYKHNRASKEKNLIHTLTAKDWKEALIFFNNSCAYCGKHTESLEHEHVIPSSKGGYYTRQNIVPACRECNNSKLDKDLFEWYGSYLLFSESQLKRILEWTKIKQDKTQQLALF